MYRIILTSLKIYTNTHTPPHSKMVNRDYFLVVESWMIHFLFLGFSGFVLLYSGGSGLESQFLLLFYDMKLYAYMCAKSLQSCPTLRHHGLWPIRLLCPWDSPGTNTGVGCLFLLQGIFPTQGSNWCLLCVLHCRQILYHWATREALVWGKNSHVGNDTRTL